MTSGVTRCGCKHPSWLKCGCSCHATSRRVNYRVRGLRRAMAKKAVTKQRVAEWRSANFTTPTTTKVYDEAPLWVRLGLSEPITITEVTPRDYVSCIYCGNRAVHCSRKYCANHHCAESACFTRYHGAIRGDRNTGLRAPKLVFFGKELEQ